MSKWSKTSAWSEMTEEREMVERVAEWLVDHEDRYEAEVKKLHNEAGMLRAALEGVRDALEEAGHHRFRCAIKKINVALKESKK